MSGNLRKIAALYSALNLLVTGSYQMYNKVYEWYGKRHKTALTSRVPVDKATCELIVKFIDIDYVQVMYSTVCTIALHLAYGQWAD